jgi:protein-S-isoprenylcysteine O-methyltransferase Ste14
MSSRLEAAALDPPASKTTRRPGRFRARHYIDAHKVVIIPATLILIAAYDAWSASLVWVYLALHGTYTACWLIKSRLFPDRSWERYVPARWGLAVFFGLNLYLLVPWLIVSGNAATPPPWFVGLCIAMSAFGIFWVFTSDMQKATSLRLRPDELITDGLWSVVRNPNYFGELLVYLGFVLLPLHWVPPLILLFVIVTEWLPRMRRKERSLSRYPQFQEYERRTKLLIPYVL